MKKTKKLNLTTETVRNLDSKTLEQVQGAGICSVGTVPSWRCPTKLDCPRK